MLANMNVKEFRNITTVVMLDTHSNCPPPTVAIAYIEIVNRKRGEVIINFLLSRYSFKCFHCFHCGELM
jgi:hypothetical protein